MSRKRYHVTIQLECDDLDWIPRVSDLPGVTQVVGSDAQTSEVRPLGVVVSETSLMGFMSRMSSVHDKSE